MRTYEQAKAFALHQHRHPISTGWYMKCQVFSRQCVGAGPFGLTARLAFNGTPEEHRHKSSPPPPGSIAYYGPQDTGYGHAVFVVEGGHVWSNDIRTPGLVDRVRWDFIPQQWKNHPYRGWIDHCDWGDLPVQKDVQDPGQGGLMTVSDHRYRQGKKVYRSKMRFRQTESDSVWNLQVALMSKHIPFDEGPTGFYGAHTRTACAAFQAAQGWHGADANGIAGPETIKRLGLVWVPD
jgi:hypothetical protein